ncbi:MAG TPA: LamG-like jellyroll fold domain-containing protein, partial [Pirellulaceae bacterium]|nr:LamG-like jellyroll fold domain-containing protein [Pirellulaceae bacterium]
MRRPNRNHLRPNITQGRQFKTRQRRFESLETRAMLATITGSTGPGGFEATVGASSLALWFDAASLGGQADGTPIASWTNNSAATGAGAAATQATGARQPTLQKDAIDLINNQPVVRFDGTDDFLQGVVTAGLEKTFYLVSSASGSPATCCSGGIYTHNSGDGGSSNGLEHVDSGGPRLFMDFPGAGNAGPTNILNNPNVGSLVYSTTGTSLYLNGATEASNAANWTKSGNEFQIGTRNNELGRFMRGDVAEAVMFNRALNTAERQIIDSALGAKYGMPTVTGDRYSGDTLANGDYDLGVFGIGRTGAGSEVLSAGQGGFGLEATALSDGTFVLAGHRQSSNSLVTIDLPGGVVSRWNRSWFVDKTGTTTNTTLAFDFTDAGLSAPAPSTTYKLLYRANTSSAFVALAATATVAGDTITFSLPDANLADGYYTLGTDIVPTVVPAVTGGTGPGGVGTVSTVSSPDLALWLKADTLTGVDGSNLTTWTNSVTSASAASAATVANTAPSLENAAGDLKNGNAVVSFSGPTASNTGDVISGTGNFTANKSLFLLAQQRSVTGTGCCQGGVTIGIDSNGLVPSGSAWSTDWGGAGDNTGSPNKLGSWSVVSGLYDNGTTFTGTRLWVDGNGSYTNSVTARGATSTTYRLGSRADNGDNLSRFFDGNIGEAIEYNSVLNSVQRVLIENYLSAKWDVPLAANDLYTGDNAGLGNYDLDLFGIGSYDATNRVENTGAAGFGLAVTSGFAPGTQFALAGHKVASNALVGSNLPAAIGQRWNRAWYVDKSGSIDATLSFDFSDAGLGAIPAGTTGYKLLYSPNNSFEASTNAFTVVSAVPSITGDKITFTLSDANFNDGYYTLGLEVSSDVVLQAAAPQAGDGLADAWRIVRNGANTEFYNGGTLVRSQATGGITSIAVQGSADNDTLTVDYSGGDPAPNIAIAYNGNGQTATPGDTLIVNGGSATNVVYRFINDHDGSVSVDGKLINYTGLEPITSNITATNVDLFYSDNAETITVTSAGVGQTMVDSTQGEAVTFINPTGRLQIHAGNVASDTIQVNGIGSGFSASLLLNGGGGSDTVTFGGAAAISLGGNLTVSAETVTQTQPITVVGTATFQAADYAAEVERDTPAIYYRLNEATGTIAAPTIGSVNGTYQNGPVLGTAGPLTGNANNLAPNFDGTNDWVQLQNAGGLLPASLFSDGAYSIEIWFSSNAGANTKDMVALTDTAGDAHGVLLETTGTRQLRFLHRSLPGSSGGQQISPSNQQYVNGTWNHLVAVHTGTQLRLYLNGVQDSVTTASTTPINYAINAALGRISVATADRFWAGGLDEFAIYDAALTPTQIQAHYAAAGGITNVTLDNAANNFSGAVSVGGGGAVSLRDANALVLGNVAVATSLTVESPAAITQTGIISGTGALTKLGDGSLTLSQANTYTGVTNVNRGNIIVAHNNALGSTAGGTIVADNRAWVSLNNGITVTGETITINGSGDNGAGESFTGALQAAGGGTATWAGTVVLGNAARVGALAGGSLVLSGDISGGNPITISGAGGTGKVVISGATKSYTGATNIVRGTLQLGAANVLPAATILDIDTANSVENSQFDLNGFNQTIGTLRRTDTPTGGGASIVTNSSATPATLTVNQSVNTSYSGNITGALALIKAGTGTLALAGATGNTYTGLTTVSGGTLDLNKTAGNAVSGDLTITSGAKVTFKRSHQIVDTATVTM